jgi:hypothetical protein
LHPSKSANTTTSEHPIDRAGDHHGTFAVTEDSEMKRSEYDDSEQELVDENPIDVLVARRLRHHRELRKKIVRQAQRVMRALPAGERRVFLRYEEFVNLRAAEREREFHDVGFESGSVAGGGEALHDRRGAEHRALVRRLRHRVMSSPLSRDGRIAALLKLVWGILKNE